MKDRVVAVFKHQGDSSALSNVFAALQNPGGLASRQIDETRRIGRNHHIPLDGFAVNFLVRSDGSVGRIVCRFGLAQAGIELRMQNNAMKSWVFCGFINAGSIAV